MIGRRAFLRNGAIGAGALVLARNSPGKCLYKIEACGARVTFAAANLPRFLHRHKSRTRYFALFSPNVNEVR